jgi:signal transduction histidine kinase
MRMMRVLVVEQSPETRRAIVDALMYIDLVDVSGAVPSCRAAIHAIAEHAPDIVVTGVDFDDGSGLDLVQAAQQVSPASRIVVVGQESTRDVWRRYLTAGAHRFVERDTSLGELRDVVSNLVTPTSPSPIDDELRLLGRMAAGVVHDLNNYLAVIRVMIEMLQQSPTDADLATSALGGVDQARRLTTTLLDQIRGKPLGFAPVDLGDLVRRTVRLVERALPTKIAMRVDIAGELRPIRGIAAELEQLVLNLVLNAADAMPDGGELVLRVLPTGAAVYFEVSDTGDGIPPGAELGVSTKPGRRAGLGLGIVHRVVERHAGAIAIARRRDRAGTIATIFFPVA